MFEKLETRRLFALPSATLSSGNLVIKGGSQADTISVGENTSTPGANPSTVHVELTEAAHNFYVTYDFVGVKGITINAGGGADTIFHTGDRIHPSILGSGGNDSISVTDTGMASSYVDAGKGNDRVTVILATSNPPGTTATSVHGGAGDDTIFVNTDTADSDNSRASVWGDGGNDTVTLYNGNTTVTGDGGADTYIIQGGNNTIKDSGGNNIYNIGLPDHSVSGGVNNITGGGGTDLFYAYDGQNTLIAGSGNDTFYTYGGSGSLNGQGGTDSWYNNGGSYTESGIEKHF